LKRVDTGRLEAIGGLAVKTYDYDYAYDALNRMERAPIGFQGCSEAGSRGGNLWAGFVPIGGISRRNLEECTSPSTDSESV
jgi:hypothetical protein